MILVETRNDDGRYGEFKKGEKGYIDGYVRGGDDTPYAVVVFPDRLVMIALNCLEPII